MGHTGEVGRFPPKAPQMNKLKTHLCLLVIQHRLYRAVRYSLSLGKYGDEAGVEGGEG